MLAFSDEALAQIAIAATCVTPDERKAWLENLAVEFEREGQRLRGRRNTRRWCERAAGGEVILKFTVDEALVAVGLALHNFLDPSLADSPPR